MNYIHGPTLDNMVWLTINFKNSKECLIFKLFVEKEKSNAWQTFFEKSIPIPYPYYYQCHFLFLPRFYSYLKLNNYLYISLPFAHVTSQP